MEKAMSTIVRLVVASSVLLAAAPAWAQVLPPPGTSAVAVASPAESRLQGFGIVLVLGDVQDAGGSSDSVPPAARAALADLKDFLPYRSYRVLDTSWLLASSTTRQAVTSRLRGPDEQDYEVVLDRLALPPSSMQIRFAMSEQHPNAAHADRRVADRLALLKRRLQEYAAQLKRAEALGQGQDEIASLRARLAQTEDEIDSVQRATPPDAVSATLIDTTFTMSLGETVVVGTSRMRGGNKALIVLLTAATRGAKPRE